MNFVAAVFAEEFLCDENAGDRRNHGNQIAYAGGVGAVGFAGIFTTSGRRRYRRRFVTTGREFTGGQTRRLQSMEYFDGGAIPALHGAVDESAPIGGALATRKVYAVDDL